MSKWRRQTLWATLAVVAMVASGIVTVTLWPRQDLSTACREVSAMCGELPPGHIDGMIVRDPQRPFLPDIIRSRQLIPVKLQLGTEGASFFVMQLEYFLRLATFADEKMYDDPAYVAELAALLVQYERCLRRSEVPGYVPQPVPAIKRPSGLSGKIPWQRKLYIWLWDRSKRASRRVESTNEVQAHIAEWRRESADFVQVHIIGKSSDPKNGLLLTKKIFLQRAGGRLDGEMREQLLESASD